MIIAGGNYVLMLAGFWYQVSCMQVWTCRTALSKELLYLAWATEKIRKSRGAVASWFSHLNLVTVQMYVIDMLLLM